MRDGVARLLLYVAPPVIVALAALFYFGSGGFGSGGASSRSQSGSVQIVGSETMRPVIAACAEEFMTRNPQADVIVQGGGSGDGIAAILHGIADIGMTSRELSPREVDFAAAKNIELSVLDLALDGVTVITHRANAVASLDFAQLQAVFTGKIRNWRELGGADSEILLYARAAGSGTAALFADRVLDGAAYDPAVQRLPTNEAIVAAVAARPGALGYTGFAALRGARDSVKTMALRADAQTAPVAPTLETIRARSYPLARVLYLGVAGKPAGAVKAFLDFCSGAPGHPLVQRAGYVAIATAAP
jgi:phosphate transport system substrate-binding protein